VTVRTKPRAPALKSGTAEEDTAKYGIRSIHLALRIIEKLAASEAPLGATELARELGVNKWRAFRHLHTLREEGYVVQEEKTEKFELSARLYLLAASLPRRFRFVEVARPEMVQLQRKTELTAVISSLVREEVFVLDNETGRSPIQVSVERGIRLELHCAAHGKVALAFGPPAIFERLSRGSLRSFTPKTITTITALRHELTRVKEQGWATAPDERYPGLNAIAAPIFSGSGKYEGGIGIFGPTQIVDARPEGPHVKAVVGAAHKISRMLGGREPGSPPAS
jgi:DNA-binding IclR family transcriptional regulator